MIRPFTALTLLAACGAGLYLYDEKHQAELLDRHISRVIHDTQATRQATSLLQADWEGLNNPDRLRPLAQKYLNLVAVQPSQWVPLSDLAARLPAPAPPGQTGGTDDGVTVAGDASQPDKPSPDTPLTVAPANPGVDDQAIAAAKPTLPTPAAHLAAHTTPRRHAPVAVADNDPPLHAHALAHSTPLALATPQPARAHILSAMARPWHSLQPAVASAIPSALGVRTALPPPVPMGAE